MELGLRVDDFDVADDGSAYFANGVILFKVSAEGVVTAVANPNQWGPSAVVSNDNKTLYWPTRGGTAPSDHADRHSLGVFWRRLDKAGAIELLAAPFGLR